MSSRWKKQTSRCLMLWWWTHRNAQTCQVSARLLYSGSPKLNVNDVKKKGGILRALNSPSPFRPLQLSSWSLPSGCLRSQAGGEVQVPAYSPTTSAAGHPQQRHWHFCEWLWCQQKKTKNKNSQRLKVFMIFKHIKYFFPSHQLRENMNLQVSLIVL